MYVYLLLALQGYCIYHCVVNKNEYYWIFVILFIPLIGSIIYLFSRAFGSSDLRKFQNGFEAVLNPTKKIKDLEKKLRFANTFKNRVDLADAYLENADYENAILHYNTALEDNFKTDYYVHSKLVEAYFLSALYDEAIKTTNFILENPSFKKSKASFYYGLALEKIGEISKAESRLLLFNAPYANYQERVAIAQFFKRINKLDQAKELLEEIIMESENMSKQSYKQNRMFIKKAQEEMTSL